LKKNSSRYFWAIEIFVQHENFCFWKKETVVDVKVHPDTHHSAIVERKIERSVFCNDELAGRVRAKSLGCARF
jgi:hypothetical protein